MENYSICSSPEMPSVQDYFEGTNIYGIPLMGVGALTLFIVILIFIDTVRYVMKNTCSKVKANTVFVLAIYPATCLISYTAIIVPRSYLLAEALSQAMVMAALYQLFCLFLSYGGGETQLTKIAEEVKLSLKVGPCCCWPCCSILPMLSVSKKTIKFIKFLVLQLPVIQGLCYYSYLLMWAESEGLYLISYWYIQPIIIASVLFGIWGMIMTITLLKTTLDPGFLLVPKFVVLQMVLILAKIQGAIFKALVRFDALPCNPPLTPQVYCNLIHNAVLMLEMVLLGYLARNVYKKNLPNFEENGLRKETVISTVFGETTAKNNNNHSEGADNNGFVIS